jgi:hypothetical protein
VILATTPSVIRRPSAFRRTYRQTVHRFRTVPQGCRVKESRRPGQSARTPIRLKRLAEAAKRRTAPEAGFSVDALVAVSATPRRFL